jgi:ribosome modulation factor
MQFKNCAVFFQFSPKQFSTERPFSAKQFSTLTHSAPMPPQSVIQFLQSMADPAMLRGFKAAINGRSRIYTFRKVVMRKSLIGYKHGFSQESDTLVTNQK